VETTARYENRLRSLDLRRRRAPYRLQPKFKCRTLQDFADMAGIEFLRIGKDTRIAKFRNELRWNEVAYK
jgi:hypothetical protein